MHTPTPWNITTAKHKRQYQTTDIEIVSNSGPLNHQLVCTLYRQNHAGTTDEDNAQIIVRAVNSYEAMREALEEVLEHSDACETSTDECAILGTLLKERLQAALALAEKGAA